MKAAEEAFASIIGVKKLFSLSKIPVCPRR